MLRKLEASEQEEQIAFVDWLLLQPKFQHHIVEIRNEGKRSAREGLIAKRMGMHVGASDLFLAVPSQRFHGLFIEMKRNKIYSASEKTKKTWQQQIRFQSSMKRNGFEAVFAFGWEHAKRIVENYIRQTETFSDEEE